jgi:hypothetical protein
MSVEWEMINAWPENVKGRDHVWGINSHRWENNIKTWSMWTTQLASNRL